MLELTPENTAEYLQHHGWLEPRGGARVSPLAWGVSNVVLRVSPDLLDDGGSRDFVVKQSRGKLRTALPWFSRLDRIFREIDVLKLLGEFFPAGTVPKVLFEDRENYLFGMEAAPADHKVWKEHLLAGMVDSEIGRQLGSLLARVHSVTAFRDDLRQKFGDAEVFHQLRLHPFYETLAGKFPEEAEHFTRLIDETRRHMHCLVLADFSPKNVLLTGPSRNTVGDSGIMLVDFETGHYGDPAFDLGFFLSHLLLKTIRHHRLHWHSFIELTYAFTERYWSALNSAALGVAFDQANLERRTWGHLAGCLWARIDGTSPIDYLPEPELAEVVRNFSRGLFRSPPSDLDQLLTRLRNVLPTDFTPSTSGILAKT